MGINFASLLPAVVDLAIKAGHEVMTVYDTNFDVQTKADASPLTEADLRSHNAIVQGLAELPAKLCPQFPILSEESATADYKERSQWLTYWLIDPLDGTKEFVKRSGEFTVNIALIHEGIPVLGVVHAPVLDLTYLAADGVGAEKRQAGAAAEKISCRTAALGPIKVVGSRSHGSEALQAYLQKMSATLGDYELVSMGSSLKLCLVAEGAADVYPRLGPTSEWDTAAAQCVVEQAGALVTNMKMEPLRYNQKDSILNPHFFVFGDRSQVWAEYL